MIRKGCEMNLNILKLAFAAFLFHNAAFVNAEGICNDIAGNAVDCNPVTNSVKKFVRDIQVNSDSVSVGDSAFTPETVLNFTNSEIKSGVEGNVANLPIVYKGCSVPSWSELEWTGSIASCKADSYTISSFETNLKNQNISQFPHGYTYSISDSTSSNDSNQKNYGKGSSSIKCNNGKWELSNSYCVEGYCEATLYDTSTDPTYPCTASRVLKPGDTVRDYSYLLHGQSAWYVNYRIGQPNHDSEVYATCDRGTLLFNGPPCTLRPCEPTKSGWGGQASSGPNGSEVYAVVAYGDRFSVPDTYAPNGNYYNCIGNVPALEHGQKARITDIYNPAKYSHVVCKAGVVMQEGASECM